MQANDLRIGNWVSHRGVADMELNIKRFEYAVCKDRCQGLQPIPITEDWLLKFGFEYNGNFYHKKIGGNEIDSHHRLGVDLKGWCGISTFSDVKYAGINSKIQYVHQLQNLYYDLTGEELAEIFIEKATTDEPQSKD